MGHHFVDHDCLVAAVTIPVVPMAAVVAAVSVVASALIAEGPVDFVLVAALDALTFAVLTPVAVQLKMQLSSCWENQSSRKNPHNPHHSQDCFLLLQTSVDLHHPALIGQTGRHSRPLPGRILRCRPQRHLWSQEHSCQ